MKFSVNWLREFAELPLSVDQLADLLTMAGIEIEGIEKRGANFDKVVVAQINASSQHPNADRLSVCQVDDGSGQPRQIVCGAKNYQVGDKVPLALPGAVLANDLKIKPSKLRGVESQGMLCSPSELGLSQDSDGLLILSAEAKIGAPIASLFPEDTILDVEITPNRGDLLSHFGLAREISALMRTPLRGVREVGRFGETSVPDKVHISAAEQCPFYSARRIENVTVGPSPDWLRAKLEAVGLRSINNIVDISNFVMLELGQPTHAFDSAKLRGEIVVRFAREGERFLALDGKTYTLTARDLVIADEERIVGIGGVMGGEETGVTASTRNVLLESAYFLPSSVRRTARTLNLPSDASYRFERGVDPGMILPASHRAGELMREIAGANPSPEIATAGGLPEPPADVSLGYEHCNELIGVTVPRERAAEILQRFGLQEAGATENESTWKIPSYRADLQRDVDLIEEIVRGFGIENVPVRYRSRFTPQSEADRNHDFESELRARLVGRGLTEVRTSKLISRRATAFEEDAIKLRNPLNEDHVALRRSFYPSLLDVWARNVPSGAHRIAIFEVGRVFIPPEGREERGLGILLWGNSGPSAHWRSHNRILDYFDLKGVIESIIPSASFKRVERPGVILAVEIWRETERIGFAGQVASEQTKPIDSTHPVLFAELNLGSFAHLEGGQIFREIEKFPAITRDIAMIVPENLSHEKVFTTIASANEPLLAKVELFDVFSGSEGQGFGAGKKSLAYALTYRDRTRTLTNDEITVVHAKIRERLQRELGVELRE